jgi:transposase
VEQFGGRVKIVEPGAVATDFGGRSFDFSNDETLTEYQPLVGKLMSSIPTMYQNASPGSVVARVIYEAATDGTNQLRYTAGEEAKVIIANRQQLDDATIIGGMKSQFGL